VRVSAIEGHRIWASSYDAGPNPLLALETRLVLDRLPPLLGNRFLDIACGTGRWMALARQGGARVVGMDFCPEMLFEASRKPGLARCLGLADSCRLPVADNAADLTLCSFALGYLGSPHQAINEMARVTRTGARIVVTDLHPRALAAGWTRSFRSDGEVYEIDHHPHSDDLWEAAAESAGLTLDWRFDACFGEPEREIFRQAGKGSSFPEVSRIPALLAMCWVKS
jgi:SAM-dependent methyltransferase